MISVTRINGTAILVNPDLIQLVERHGDTVISLVNGDKVLVKEGLDVIADKVVKFRASVLAKKEGGVL